MSFNGTSVCVFCGARDGRDAAFRDAAIALGDGLAKAGHRLVYGAGDIGLMGAVADATKAAGGATLGVIPVHLIDREGRRADLSQLVVTENMHERKKVMFMNSDAIVVLPGGAGTLDELFEVLTWRQLGLHRKPIIVLNIAGYWDPLVALVDSVIDHGFADATLAPFLTVTDTVPGALNALSQGLSP